MKDHSKLLVLAIVLTMAFAGVLNMCTGESEGAEAETTPSEGQPEWYDPEADEYTLRDAEDLRQFADIVNTGQNDFYGKKVSLEAGKTYDISGAEWTPIGITVETETGYVDHPFRGSFNGNDAVITGLTLTGDNTPSYNGMDIDGYHAYGFFGGVVEGSVSNLVFESFDIDTPGVNINNNTVAVAVGALVFGGTVENITVGTEGGEDKVTGVSRTAGIVGYIGGAKNGSPVTAITGDNVAGEFRIIGNTNNADIVSNWASSSHGTAAGILATANIKESTGTMTYTVSGNNNNGDVTGYFAAGMVASDFCRHMAKTISDNTNTGNISTTEGVGTGGVAAGIMVHQSAETATANMLLTGNTNTGDVTSSGGTATGIVGTLYLAEVSRNVNTGAVSGFNVAAGIATSLHGGSIRGNENSGAVTATNTSPSYQSGDNTYIVAAGGIVAFVSGGSLGETANTGTGEVSGSVATVGRILGYASYGDIYGLNDSGDMGAIRVIGNGAFTLSLHDCNLEEVELMASHNQSSLYTIDLSDGSSIGSISGEGVVHTGMNLMISGGNIASISLNLENNTGDGTTLNLVVGDDAVIGSIDVITQDYYVNVAAEDGSSIGRITTDANVRIGVGTVSDGSVQQDYPNEGSIGEIYTDQSVSMNASSSGKLPELVVYIGTDTSMFTADSSVDTGLFNAVASTAYSGRIAEDLSLREGVGILIMSGSTLEVSAEVEGIIIGYDATSNIKVTSDGCYGDIISAEGPWDPQSGDWALEPLEYSSSDVENLRWKYDYTDQTLYIYSSDGNETEVPGGSYGVITPSFSDVVEHIVASEDVTEIGAEAISGTVLESVIFEGVVTTYGSKAIYSSANLTQVSFGAGTQLTAFENGAFSENTSLNSISIGDEVYILDEDGNPEESTGWNGGVIDSIDDFQAFAQMVNSGVDFAGTTVTLGSGLDLSSTGSWTPIGNGVRSGGQISGNHFSGVFEGNGYTISGLSIAYSSGTAGFKASSAVGLFGIVAGDGAEIRNLKLSDVTITSDAENNGAVVGILAEGAVVSDVDVVSGSIHGVEGTGGIAGRILKHGTVENCDNHATISATSTNIGGIVGAAYYNNEGIYITGCINYGNVSSLKTGVGGIVGLSSGYISDCDNFGNVEGAGSVGGIVGEQRHSGYIRDCSNGSSTDNDHSIKNTTGGYGTGGVVGWVRYVDRSTNYPDQNMIEISDCENHGAVGYEGSISEDTDETGLGGIVGVAYHSILVERCTNYADLTGDTFVAGIVGAMQTTDGEHCVTDGCRLILIDNTNLGTITGTNSSGPIIGHFSSKDDSTKQSCMIPGGSNWTVYGNKIADADGSMVEYEVPGIESSFTITKADQSGEEIVYGYPTLTDAVAGAVSGDTISMIVDTTITSRVELSKEIVLDLGQFTLSIDSTEVYGLVVLDKVTITNGVVSDISYREESDTEVRYGLFVTGSSADVTLTDVVIQQYEPIGESKTTHIVFIQNGASATIGSGTLIQNLSQEGSDNGPGTCGVSVIGGGANAKTTLHVLDGATILASTYAIAGNGNNDGTVITIEGGTISSDIVAIFHPQEGDITISGGTITGLVGLQFTGTGKVEITDGTITSTDIERTSPFKDPGEGDGSILDGAALSIVSRGGNYQSEGDGIVVNITGGRLVSQNNSAIADYRISQNADGAWVVGDASDVTTNYLTSMTISGDAEIIGGSDKPALWVDSISSGRYSISGGRFSSDVSEYCADGKVSVKTGDVYTVVAGWTVTFRIDGQEDTTVNVADGGTVQAPTLPTTAPGYSYRWMCNGTAWSEDTPITRDITVIAEKYISDLSVEVTIDSSGGTASFTAVVSTAIANPELTYAWEYAGNPAFTSSISSISSQGAGDYIVTVTVKDADGLTSTVSKTFTYRMPTPEDPDVEPPTYDIEHDGDTVTDLPPITTGEVYLESGGNYTDIDFELSFTESEDEESYVDVEMTGTVTGGTISIQAGKLTDDVAEGVASEFHPDADASKDAVAVQVTVDDKVSDFLLIIKVPVTPTGGSYIGTAAAYYIGDDGQTHSITSRVYYNDFQERNEVWIYTDHTTDFIVVPLTYSDVPVYEGDPTVEPEPDTPDRPVINPDDDYVPLPPIVSGSSDSSDDTVTIVACAAAAVVAALMAVFLVLTYRKD